MHTRVLRHKFRMPRAASGIVLPLVLIFLVILTILGVYVIRNVTLEERMASGSRYLQLAFQSAEQALRNCERDVLDNAVANKFYASQATLDLDEIPNVGGTAGTYWDPKSANSRWGSGFKSDSGTVANRYNRDVVLSGPANGLLTAQCMVEKMNATASRQSGVPKVYCPFRVTARANNTSGDPVVMVQSILIAPPKAGNLCP